jgi:hypothetical protein
MPKDEFDFDDPMELSGVALATDEDTTDLMCECFIEEFMRLGYNAKQILALFRNPHYLGMNMVLQNRGEPFVRDRIADVFARWGRPIESRTGVAPVSNPDETQEPGKGPDNGDRRDARPTLTDPMGAPIPDVTV